MCLGTYVVSYSCGHVVSTPNVCLRDVAPHYRCEPRGMKITQPNGRCVECYTRDLSPHEPFTTTARFNPDPLSFSENKVQTLTPQSSIDSSELNDAILKWARDIPDPGTEAVPPTWDYTTPAALGKLVTSKRPRLKPRTRQELLIEDFHKSGQHEIGKKIRESSQRFSALGLS